MIRAAAGAAIAFDSSRVRLEATPVERGRVRLAARLIEWPAAAGRAIRSWIADKSAIVRAQKPFHVVRVLSVIVELVQLV